MYLDSTFCCNLSLMNDILFLDDWQFVLGFVEDKLQFFESDKLNARFKGHLLTTNPDSLKAN